METRVGDLGIASIQDINALPFEIASWSTWMEQHGPGGSEGHEWIGGVIKGHNSERNDVRSFADLLDFDDYLSYGGKA